MPSVDDGTPCNPDTPQLKGPSMIARRRPIRLSFTAARNQSGMSLLEIIIVIVLIGKDWSPAALGGADRKANIAKAQVQTVASKIDNYQIDTGKLPATLKAGRCRRGRSPWPPRPADLNDPGPRTGVPGAGRRPAV